MKRIRITADFHYPGALAANATFYPEGWEGPVAADVRKAAMDAGKAEDVTPPKGLDPADDAAPPVTTDHTDVHG